MSAESLPTAQMNLYLETGEKKKDWGRRVSQDDREGLS